MSLEAIEAVARAVLYEGLLLYPYRRSSLKNRRRWMWGSLAPRQWAERAGEPFRQHVELLVEGDAHTRIELRVRFLAAHSDPGEGPEVEERELRLEEVSLTGPGREVVGRGRSSQAESRGASPRIRAGVTVRVDPVRGGLTRLSVEVENRTELGPTGSRAEAELLTMASTHVLGLVAGGAFVSLLETPERHREEAAGCKQHGLWPVLVGRPGVGAAVLAAPIILYDYPVVAPESPGDLFDATEIDEILTLRILTLSEAERAELRAAGGRGRALLERTERLSSEALRALHGAVRSPPLAPDQGAFQAGDRVRLCPAGRSDVFDLALRGRTATVAKVEHDLEDQVFLAVTVDDDPGADLGRDGQVGHRFFFRPEEVERL